jgi:hypothetical protein
LQCDTGTSVGQTQFLGLIYFLKHLV